MAVKAVTALVSSPDHEISCWTDYYRLYSIPSYQLVPASAAELDLAAKIEQQHGYHFKHPRLLCSAFIHPSYPSSWSNKIPCYQRLEFLGDALLDMVCVNFLFHRHPDQDPQWLTEHKVRRCPYPSLEATKSGGTDGYGIEQISGCLICQARFPQACPGWRNAG